MKRYKLYLVNILLLFMMVPLFFINTNMNSIGGFPFWALYSLLSTFVYAITIWYLLSKYWSTSASE